ncbi:hypothetical protein BU26DRAFT_191591 [Trematosphaeria pertusa]|uniref:Mis14-domain-containing protein n=1 Tax=Trematosphaeria pertusa TaxID=390896 RepID=A0A6A6HTS8_9PLEO|nr:uncharacterized protein BU26DRAFT_191591 [Trematosphaeria pertusa]KAF2240830.1 hypothetical protein BU26DRAFT_191591 [Trematosphaeria pertusa]
MDSEHRKIELQSPGDLTYLTSQIRTVARKKIDLHLPPHPDSSEPDDLRAQVEDLVDAFVAQVLAGLRHNISINGIDVVKRGSEEDGDGDADGEKMDVNVENAVVQVEDFEPFDEKLRGRLGAAVQKRDALVAKISQHRRTTPALAARRWEEQFSREMEELERGWREGQKRAVEMGEQDVLGVQGVKRREEVERNWERAVEGLGRLQKGLPETRARLERCGDVVGYLQGGGKEKEKGRV